MLQEEDEESKQWLSIQSERIVRSAEAAVVILNITTAQNMPKQVYLEEAIEHVATFCQHHLESIIFPEFDPIYRSADVKGMTKSMFLLNQIPLLFIALWRSRLGNRLACKRFRVQTPVLALCSTYHCEIIVDQIC